MPRPRKQRTISFLQKPAIYKPAGVPLDQLRQVRLLPEELEALRLADLEALNQVEAARVMNVSRSTFQRILAHAHRQVAMALVEGCALNVEGSTFEIIPPLPRKLAQG